jgi:hypothetical protein
MARLLLESNRNFELSFDYKIQKSCRETAGTLFIAKLCVRREEKEESNRPGTEEWTALYEVHGRRSSCVYDGSSHVLEVKPNNLRQHREAIVDAVRLLTG